MSDYFSSYEPSEHMKWWGWGAVDKTFDISCRPALWPYIVKVTGLPDQLDAITHPPVKEETILLPDPKLPPECLAALKSFLKPDQIAQDSHERLVHSYGKSFRDLWRIRNGIVPHAPDCICYPESEEDVCRILNIASQFNVVIIPFGGGSNIVGCLEAIGAEGRAVISLDMRLMNRVVEIDETSLTARIQAGAMGPELEEQLNAGGFTLGHFPDSFEYSSLGGWVATRSAGMQSDKYGKIEDMVIGLKMVTPQGKIITRTVPKASNGIDVKHFCIGSEGILGVITEVTLQVHRIPERKQFYGYLFPNFEKGVAAIQECLRKGYTPVVTRLGDSTKTALSFAFKTQGSRLQTFIGKLLKLYLRRVKRMNLQEASLLIIGIEGAAEEFKKQRRQVNAIYRKHGGVSLGASPGRSFEKGKYDFPYIRDFGMDRGLIADVSETSTVWSNLLPLYYKVREAINEAIAASGGKPWCSCHISHTYHAGASLYFTFVSKQKTGEELAQYDSIKKAAEDTFIRYGGTLSHHHAVGTEHLPWMEQEVSTTGITALQALKKGLDPQGIMNPGKLIPSEILTISR